jgi:predicted transcriptional regulator
MPSSTTLKLSEKLKTRIITLAKAAGKTPHAFMVEALETQAALAERRREFVAVARAAEQEVAKYGLVYDSDEVFAYIKDKLAGKKPKRPKATRF